MCRQVGQDLEQHPAVSHSSTMASMLLCQPDLILLPDRKDPGSQMTQLNLGTRKISWGVKAAWIILTTPPIECRLVNKKLMLVPYTQYTYRQGN